LSNSGAGAELAGDIPKRINVKDIANAIRFIDKK
jgi:hypothetical protein